MSFSGQSNPPWQRSSINNSIQGMGYHQNTPMYMSPQSNQSQSMQYNQMTSSNMSSMSSSQVYQQNVSYPSRSGLNPVAFPSTGTSSQSSSQSSAGVDGQSRQNYNSVGTVTKVSNDCGLISDEILFYKNICKGVVPKVGDSVLFESSYSPSGQFKWNATRVQLVSQASQQATQSMMAQNAKSTGYAAVPPPSDYIPPSSQRRSGNPPRRSSPERHLGRDRKEVRRSRERVSRVDDELDRKRRRDDSPKSRYVERRDPDKSSISIEKRVRERSPVRRPSPKRRKPRVIPRYVVQIPKTSLTLKSAEIQDIKRRYPNLYLPSDFFHAEIVWPESFTPANPLSIRRQCSFEIMSKTVVPPGGDLKDNTEPDDIDYLFSAKVMLLGCPSLTKLYEKCFNQDEYDDTRNCLHPSRLFSFLVGMKGRNEPMAIGGPWSPSLDGENPDKDPQVLIRTAIRTCLSLTGIDLSKCTQWYRFMELYYHRADYTSKGKTIPSRVETVVIYLPDINSCIPTASEWENIAVEYKAAAANHLNRIKNTGQLSSVGESSQQKPIQRAVDGDEMAAVPASRTSLANLGGNDADKHHDEIGQEKDDLKKEPSHYSKLDLKSMKIQDIRNELVARKLSPKGLRPQVVARLSKALTTEKEKETAEAEEDREEAKAREEDYKEDDEDMIELDMTDIVILDEYDSSKCQEGDNGMNEKEPRKELGEKECKQLERRYSLPSEPHILVNPSKTAKGGKFDCAVLSLSVLLDYRATDTKERFFEVSLFAELFNEMLIRDFGFNIMKEIYLYQDPAPEKTESIKNAEDDKIAVESNSRNQADDKKGSHENDKKDRNHRERRVSKRLAEDELDDDVSVHSPERRRRSDKKMYVAKPMLLLSFVYFDTSHCGYIFEKDLEDLCTIMGLNMSRSQIRKLLSKSISRHALYYRKLTDAEVTETEENPIKDIEDNPEVLKEIQKLSDGNNPMLPVFKYGNRALTGNDNQTLAEGSDIVTHNGIQVHVGQLFEQNKRYDRVLSDLEKRYTDLKKQTSELQGNYNRTSNRAKDLQAEVKSLLRKLSDADQDLFSLNRKYNEQHLAIQYVYDKVHSFVARSDKAHKSSDSQREREKEKREEKEKEKKDEKDKEKDKKDEKEKEKEKKGDREKEQKDVKEKEENDAKMKEEKTEKDEKDKNIETEDEKMNETTMEEEKEVEEADGKESEIADVEEIPTE